MTTPKYEALPPENLNRVEIRTDFALMQATLAQMGQEIETINQANGWTPPTPEDWQDCWRIPGHIALVHSEASEALEAFRKGDFANFSEELADLLIRTVGLAHGLRVDLASAVAAKLEKNRKRSYRHGGKRS